MEERSDRVKLGRVAAGRQHKHRKASDVFSFLLVGPTHRELHNTLVLIYFGAATEWPSLNQPNAPVCVLQLGCTPHPHPNL